MVVRGGDRFNQLFCVGEPFREAGLLDVPLGATHAVIIGHDLRVNQIQAPYLVPVTARRLDGVELTKVPAMILRIT